MPHSKPSWAWVLPVCTAFVSSVAGATDVADGEPEGQVQSVNAPTSHAQAEYYRLSQELEKLAQRNAWAGVERTYRALVETGVSPTFDDFLYGAYGARAVGDVTSARARLLAANTIREEREVLDWLWEIDSNYGQVYLAADPGAVEFRVDSMPFEPNQAKAVEFAQTQITEIGVFEGYLPQGTYWFGTHEVKVQPRVQAVRIDIRTDNGKKKKKKKKG